MTRYKEALRLYRAVGDRLGEANVLQAQGDVLAFLDQRDEGVARYEEALRLFRAVGDRLGEANVLKAQGDVLAFLDQRLLVARQRLVPLIQKRQHVALDIEHVGQIPCACRTRRAAATAALSQLSRATIVVVVQRVVRSRRDFNQHTRGCVVQRRGLLQPVQGCGDLRPFQGGAVGHAARLQRLILAGDDACVVPGVRQLGGVLLFGVFGQVNGGVGGDGLVERVARLTVGVATSSRPASINWASRSPAADG